MEDPQTFEPRFSFWPNRSGLKPLYRVPSLKLKLSLLIVAAVAISAAMSQIGLWLSWPVWVRPLISGVISLGLVNLLAKGTTFPLTQMTKAAKAMASGDFRQQVEASSADEVGQLALAFKHHGSADFRT